VPVEGEGDVHGYGEETDQKLLFKSSLTSNSSKHWTGNGINQDELKSLKSNNSRKSNANEPGSNREADVPNTKNKNNSIFNQDIPIKSKNMIDDKEFDRNHSNDSVNS